MKILGRISSVARNCCADTLHAIDNVVGIEIFKLAIVFSTVYFVQGMGGLSRIPLLFYFKDVLHFDAAQLQYFGAITGLAWLVKPLFGFISDRFPICGYRRKSYMILMAFVAAISWWILAWMVENNCSDYAYLVLVFNFSALGYAFVDVVCDGLMVERGQAFKLEENFVNIQWFALGVAGFISGLYSGELQAAVKAGTISLPWIFIAIGCVPLLTSIIAGFFVKEEKIKKSAKTNCQNVQVQKIDLATIKEVASSKIFWILSAFIFFWNYSPSFGGIFQYYQIDIMRFDEKFLGKIQAIGGAIFPLSILFYAGCRKYFPKFTIKHWLYANIGLGILGTWLFWFYLLPESRLNWVCFGVSLKSQIAVSLIALAILLLSLWRLQRRISTRINEHKLHRQHKGLTLSKNTLKRIKKLDPVIKRLAKWQFVIGWFGLLMPASLLLSLWFAGFGLTDFTLNYRSFAMAKGGIFDYLGIASFLIPLALAAKLAPKKAEGMVYAYFMALSNLSRNNLPDLSGAWMFEVLKKMLQEPAALIKTIPSHYTLDMLMGLAFIASWSFLVVLLVKIRKEGKGVWVTLFMVLGVMGWLMANFLSPLINCLKLYSIYLIQQSYLLFSPIIGNADFLGQEAYRALILRYSAIISVIFILISIYFVYLLPLKKQKKNK